MDYFKSKTSIIKDSVIGTNSKIWEYANIYGTEIGKNCNIGSFVEIQKDTLISDNVTISSHSFICSLVEIMNVSIKNFLKTIPEDYTLELIYKDTPIGDVKNFFDIDHNNWKMTGVISAVQRAQKICRNL